MECTVVSRMEAADHWIVYSEVREGRCSRTRKQPRITARWRRTIEDVAAAAVPSHSQIVHKTQDALIHHPGRTLLEHLRHAPDHLKLAAFHMVHHDILFTRRWDITKVDYHRRCTVHGANFHSRKEFICRVRATALACLTRSSAPSGLSQAR